MRSLQTHAIFLVNINRDISDEFALVGVNTSMYFKSS